MKHTPGPWRFSGVGPKGSIRKIFLATDTSVYHVADVQLDRHDTFSDTDANARLIAAAPDLLKALSWAVVQMDRAGMATLSMREAITKATGE